MISTAKFSQTNIDDLKVNEDDDDDDEALHQKPVDENFPGREIYHELKKDGSNFDEVMKAKFGEEPSMMAK